MFKDLTGNKYGRLTVIQRDKSKGENVMWKCTCECGKTVTVRSSALMSGNTKSCGCYHSDRMRQIISEGKTAHPIHNDAGKRLYRIWRSMKDRCYSKKHKYYNLYGGRGITICDEWIHDYPAFKKWAIDNGYKDDQSIDRIDNDKGYYPENCRFIYYKDQPKNRRTNHMIEVNGEKITVSECSRKYGIPISTIICREKNGRDVLTRVRRW